jgi:catechol 2,3-dioxygenase-like lactoylglutathione lyase family enzyme
MGTARNRKEGYYPVTIPNSLKMMTSRPKSEPIQPVSSFNRNEDTAMKLSKASQCLIVSDVQRSQDYYRDQLGFTIDGQFVERDGVSFLIKKADSNELIRPNHTVNGFMDTYIWVDNIDDVYKDLKARGAALESEPTNQSYGMREFLVYDIDGYRFCIGGPLT